MGMVMPIMLSYNHYKQYEKNKELRQKGEPGVKYANKKYETTYIWETQCPSYVRNCPIRLGSTKEEKQ
tara:strand:- start:480 stop:683 length:204 start_codon:yes stop_codon:yes gene_type:complete